MLRLPPSQLNAHGTGFQWQRVANHLRCEELARVVSGEQVPVDALKKADMISKEAFIEWLMYGGVNDLHV